MKVRFVNRDHDDMEVRWTAGGSYGSITLMRGESDDKESGPNPLRYCWKPGTDNISEQEFDDYSVLATSATVTFGSPPGRVP